MYASLREGARYLHLSIFTILCLIEPSQQPFKAGTLVIPLLELRKLRHRECVLLKFIV